MPDPGPRPEHPERFAPQVVRRTYDTVADEYAATFGDDLERLPFDRRFLDDLGARLPATGPVLDVGCGPGQVAAYLGDHGAEPIGVDVAPRMVALARQRRQGLPVIAGDLRRLPLRSGCCAGVVAFYALPFLRRDELPAALVELRRVLVPGGVIGAAVHLGRGEIYGDDHWLSHAVEPIGVTLFEADEVDRALASASFRTAEARQRGPLAHEHQGPRLYVLAVAAAR